MKYKDALNKQMIELANDPKRVFIGYNLKNGSRCYGTMAGVSVGQIIEMPVAEALMAGMATGLALSGMKPVLIFERHDFMLLASDQIINHMDKIFELSHGRYNPCVIIRAIVGDKKPFDPGIQHLQDFTELFNQNTQNTCVTRCQKCSDIDKYYEKAILEKNGNSMIVDYRGLYDLEC